MTRKELERRIEEFKRQGKEIIIIDDWMLCSHKDLCKKCKRIYVLGRKFTQRREGIIIRDNSTIEEAKVGDIPFALGYVERPKGINVEIINNYGSLEELKAIMEEKYDQMGVKGFEEKYKIKDKSILERLGQVSRGTVSMNRMLQSIRTSKEKEDA